MSISVMGEGDSFQNIARTNIINKSLVQGSFNKVERDYGEETKKALEQVSKMIEESKNPAATALFNSFNQELNKPQPEKSTLKGIWDGIVTLLPSVVTIAKGILPLFA